MVTKAKVLIVEDDGIVANDIEYSLTSLGYTVTAKVASADEAINKGKEDAPDLVLMDIMLKGETDGIDAAKYICSELDIPVVYLTAYASYDLIERAKITEPFGYIIKPFDDGDLSSAIEIALYKKKIERELKLSNESLEKMNSLMIGREIRMEELKVENRILKEKCKEL